MMWGLLLLLLGLVTQAEAATYFVAKTGSDSNNCTAAQTLATAKLTVISAIPCLNAGDTLTIKAGTYTETGQISAPDGGTSSNRIIVEGAAGETVTLRIATNQHVINFNSPSQSYVTMRNLILDGQFTSSTFWNKEGAVNVILQDMEIKNSKESCVQVGGTVSSNNMQFLNLKVHDCGFNSGTGTNTCTMGDNFCHGFYVSGNGHLWDGGETYNCDAYGYHLYPETNNSTIRNVRAHNDAAIGLLTGTNNEAYNNVIYDNGGTGIAVGSGGNRVYNNTVYSNTQNGIWLNTGNNIVRNNIAYANGNNNIAHIGSGFSNTFSNNLCNATSSFCAVGGNPLFTNTATFDFTLQSGSPAINAGTNLSPTVTTDILGVSRPQPAGGAYDIGAYEFAADTTPPTITGRVPASAATNVSRNTTVVVTFSEAMLASSLTTSTVLLQHPTSGTVAATVTPAATTATLTPSTLLDPGILYTVVVKSGASGVKDATGNALAAPDVTWNFTTTSPTTYHVAKTGSDSNTCTAAQSASTPKLTINGGIDCLAGGDTLIVHAGNYDERIRESGQAIPSGLSESQRTTLQAAPGESVWLMPTANLSVFLIYGRSFVTIDGINIDSSNAPATNSFGVLIGQVSQSITYENATIRNVRGTAGPADGSQVCLTTNDGDGGSGHKFLNLILENCGTGTGEYGLYITSANTLVEGNQVRGNSSHGIFVGSGADVPETTIVRNNIVYSNGGAGIAVANGTGHAVYNNIVYGNTSDGLQLTGGGILALNNTVHNNGGIGVAFGSGTGNTVQNNILNQNVGGGTGPTTGHTVTFNLCGAIGTGCAVVGDPLFVNAASNDFQIQAGSPAVNAGTSTAPTVTADFANVVRPQGAAYDIGAYEYVGAVIPPGGPVVFEAAGTGSSGAILDTTATLTNFTCTNSNTVLYLGVCIRETNTTVTTVTAPTYNGQTFTDMTPVIVPASGTRQVTLSPWRLLPGAACDGAPHPITVNISASKFFDFGVISLTGVNQTTPNDTPGTTIDAGGAATDPDGAVITSETNDMIIGFVGSRNSGTVLTPVAGQTDRFNVVTTSGTASSNVRCIGATEPGAASVQLQWTTAASTTEAATWSVNVNQSLVAEARRRFVPGFRYFP